MKRFKKISAAAVSGLVIVSLISGCGGNKIDGKKIVATVNDAGIPLGVLNLSARWTQANMEDMYKNYFGVTGGIWDGVADENTGLTYGAETLQGTLEELESMYVLKETAPEYGVELSDENKKAISDAAAAFIEANSEETLKELGVDQSMVETYLELLTYQHLMEEAVKEKADISLDEAAAQQSTYTFVEFDFPEETAADSEDSETEEIVAEPDESEVAAGEVAAEVEETEADAETAEASDEKADAEEAEAPAEETDAKEAEAPAEETDAEVAEAPAEEADAEVAEAPAEEADAKETEAPAEEADAEVAEAPAEEAGTEVAEAPAEEAGAEETDEDAAETPAEDGETDASTEEVPVTKEDQLLKANQFLGAVKVNPDGDWDAMATAIDENLFVDTESFTTVDSDEEWLANSQPEVLLKELRSLSDGEICPHVIETDDAYYVVRLDKVNDEEVTKEVIDNQLDTLKQDYYNEKADTWKSEADIKVDDKVLSSIEITDSHTFTMVSNASEEDADEGEEIVLDDSEEEADASEETTEAASENPDPAAEESTEAASEGADAAAEESTEAASEAADNAAEETTEAASEAADGAAEETTEAAVEETTEAAK